jgi:hypothetical protein
VAAAEPSAPAAAAKKEKADKPVSKDQEAI